MKNLFVLTLFLSFLNVFADRDVLKKYARNLSDLRKEIQLITNDIKREKNISSSRIMNLMERKNSLETELRILKMKIAEAQREVGEYNRKIEKAEKPLDATKKVFLDKIEKLIETVQSGIPFKRDERVKYLENMRSEFLQSGGDLHATSVKFLSFMEDEFKMSRETVFTKAPLEMEENGTPVLAGVVRVGTFVLFAEKNGRYGMFYRAGEKDWKYREIEKKEELSEVKKLFESFKNRVDRGVFYLPFAGPGAYK